MDAAELVLELKATREIALPDGELRDLVAFLIEQAKHEKRSAPLARAAAWAAWHWT